MPMGVHIRGNRQRVATFWEKVNVKRDPNACWLWLGSLSDDGYGSTHDGRRTIAAHRFSLQIKLGRLLRADECALHDCPDGDNRACVNPRHLYLGTVGDNNRDTVRKGKWKGCDLSEYVRGERHPAAKLTDDDVRQIRKYHKTGRYSQYELAAMFGIKQPQIGGIVRGEYWRHVR